MRDHVLVNALTPAGDWCFNDDVTSVSCHVLAQSAMFIPEEIRVGIPY